MALKQRHRNRLYKMATKDTKWVKIWTRTWPTPQKVKWLYLKFRQGTFVPPLSLRGSLLLGSVWLIGQPGPICLKSWLVLSTNKVHNCDQLDANVTYKVLILQGEVWCQSLLKLKGLRQDVYCPFTLSISNGNRTEWSPMRSVLIRVINKHGRPICLITSMITDRIWTTRSSVTN